MFTIASNTRKTVMYITLSGHFDVAEAELARAAILVEAAQMGPVFDLISDIRKCQPAAPECQDIMSQVLGHLAKHGLRRMVRVTQIVLSALQADRASQEAGVDFISVHSLTDAENLIATWAAKGMVDAERKWEQVRLHRRVQVGPEYTIQFTAGGKEFRAVRITNISAQGCFAVMEHQRGRHLYEGAILVDFALEHRDLPGTRVSAKVVRMVDHLAEVSDNDIGLGVKFLTSSSRFCEQIDSYVNSLSPGN